VYKQGLALAVLGDPGPVSYWVVFLPCALACNGRHAWRCLRLE